MREDQDPPAETHKGLPVIGYRPEQSPEALELVNHLKGLEEQVASALLAIVQRSRELASGVTPHDEDGRQRTREHQQTMRAVALARTHIETGFMYAAKGVFRPTAGLYVTEL